MKILLLYPKFPETFWSFTWALKFVSKKSGTPPLGLVTIASMLPESWERKLIDTNVSRLRDSHIAWADYVFISGMSVQKQSAQELVDRCSRFSAKVVAGGPLFSTSWDDFPKVDHFILNEAEITLPEFLQDLEEGSPRRMYTTERFADMRETPAPDWRLIKMKKYASMSIQYSRGCPYNCDFCDITLLYGRKVRIKNTTQIIGELENIYQMGWRDSVFFVDDNFIAHKAKLKKETLPAVIQWMKKRSHPFVFNTQASINIADDEELMQLMVEAGFDKVFIGIETPSEEGLEECSKVQNEHRDLVACVKKIHSFGMEVQGGFIVGFDSDPWSIFEDQIRFIQDSAIVTAMVGLLTALKGTKLYKRLQRENRLLGEETGNNTDCTLNFEPSMDKNVLLQGYKRIVSTIYSPSYYYKRVHTFLKEYRPPVRKHLYRFKPIHIITLIKTTFFLGIIGKERLHYWRLMFWTIFRRPRLFPTATTLAIYGFHHRKVCEKYIRNEGL
ncbi:MAG: B12-binding domain-containing radical SAM protein [Spirochaetia bacterium]